MTMLRLSTRTIPFVPRACVRRLHAGVARYGREDARTSQTWLYRPAGFDHRRVKYGDSEVYENWKAVMREHFREDAEQRGKEEDEDEVEKELDAEQMNELYNEELEHMKETEEASAEHSLAMNELSEKFAEVTAESSEKLSEKDIDELFEQDLDPEAALADEIERSSNLVLKAGEDVSVFEPFPEEVTLHDFVQPLMRVVPESTAFYMRDMEYIETLLQLQELDRKYSHLPRLPQNRTSLDFHAISTSGYAELGLSAKPSTYHEIMEIVRSLATIRPDVRPDEVSGVLSVFSRQTTARSAVERQKKIDTLGRAFGKGKRKNALARVWIVKGNGQMLVNGRTLTDLFGRTQDREKVAAPLRAIGMLTDYNVFGLVEGGGTTGK